MSIVRRAAHGVEIERGWTGKTVVCIASGPSTTFEQLEMVKAARAREAVRVIAVNDMYLVAPWADICYFADTRWYGWQKQGIAKSWPWIKFSAEEARKAFESFSGQKVKIDHPEAISDPQVLVLKNLGCEGLSLQQNGIHTGINSGYQALNIAVLAGGNPILLVGYDMRFHGARSHSHNGHPLTMPESSYGEYAKKFSSTQIQLNQLGVQVWNCTPNSVITAFQRGDLAGLLAAAD